MSNLVSLDRLERAARLVPASELALGAGVAALRFGERALAKIAPEYVPHAVEDEAEPAALPADGLYGGLVRLDLGPIERFSDLTRLEDAAREIEAVSGVVVEKVSGGRATLALRLAERVALVALLEERSPVPFRVRMSSESRLVLDLEPAGSATAAA
jgi:hypothetical protein